MRTDDDFVADVRTRLHAEMEIVRPAPTLLRTVRRRHAARVLAVRASVAVAVAAAGVLAVTVPGWRDPAGTPSADPTTVAVVPVAQQTTTALAKVSEYLVRTRNSEPRYGSFEVLYDPATGRDRFTSYSPGGAVRSEIATAGRPSTHPTVTVVDHVRRSWWTYRDDPPPELPAETVDRNDAIWDPARIASDLANGTARELGHEQLAGRDTVRLQVQTARDVLTLWVDTETYLPLQASNRGGTTRYTWLARNAENQALLDLKPPAGFTHLKSAPSRPTIPGGGVG
jgi:hypothetical protein